MASEQGSGDNSGAVDDKAELQKLRERLTQERFKHYPILARLEEPKDRIYATTISSDDGRLIGKVRFRKWEHGEVGYFLKLPFYHKIANNLDLTEEEKTRFAALKAEMVQLAILDKNRWAELSNDSRFVDMMFFNIQYISGLDKKFAEDLDGFLNDDLGFMYGYIWFHEMHLTPSQVAQLPESDVSAVTLWFSKWFQRVEANKPNV